MRVYLPLTSTSLAEAHARGGFGAGRAHAVTAHLAAALGTDDEEELEYAASTAAAHEVIGLLTEEDQPLRIVAALDVDRADPQPGHLTAVRVEGVPLRRLAALLADSPDAGAAVRSGQEALAAGGSEDHPAVQRCLDHELGWYAAQELEQLLDR